MTEDYKFNPERGTVSMWISLGSDLEDAFSLRSGKELVSLSDEDGGLKITLTGNRIQASFVSTGRGRVDLEHEFEANRGRHMVAVSWELVEANEVILYIDGEEVDKKEF